MDQEKIGKFIADRRKKKKLTQEELASILNVNSRSISRWENGKCMPDISLYNSICEVLEISVNELLSGEKIDNEKYQEKFEANMINVLSGVELKNKNLRKVNLVVLFISVFIISFILISFTHKLSFISFIASFPFIVLINTKETPFSSYNFGYALPTPHKSPIVISEILFIFVYLQL